MSVDVKAVVDCSTGETTMLPLTAKEKKERVAFQQEMMMRDELEATALNRVFDLKAKLAAGGATQPEILELLSLTRRV